MSKSLCHALVWIGTHNAIYKEWTDRTGRPLDLSETDPMKNPLLLPNVIDSPLTPKGRDQCAEQRPAACALEGVELIVISPLVRCLQTAHITFEDHLPHNTPRMVKWMAHEGVREELGTLLCNKRRALSETEPLFPCVDFTRVPHGEDDVMWENHIKRTANDDGIPTRETMVDMSQRSYDFLVDFLQMRPEREMVVVGHSAWLLAMTRAVLDVDSDDEGLITPMFGQAEMRSMELVFTEQR
jgi:broad specificity phosphatase PhoE